MPIYNCVLNQRTEETAVHEPAAATKKGAHACHGGEREVASVSVTMTGMQPSLTNVPYVGHRHSTLSRNLGELFPKSKLVVSKGSRLQLRPPHQSSFRIRMNSVVW